MPKPWISHTCSALSALMSAQGLAAPHDDARPTAPAASSAGEPSTLPAGDGPEVDARLSDWKMAAAVAPESIAFVPPVAIDRVSSTFGMRSDPFLRIRRRHAGIDIPALFGTPVRAAADGVVLAAGRAGGYGNLIEIEHGPLIETRYAHLSQIDVAPGALVRRGDIIGLIGSTGRSTGSHLHFEVRRGGQAVNPLEQLSDELAAPMPAPPATPERLWTVWSTNGEANRLPSAHL